MSRPEALVALDAIAVTSVSGTRPGGRVAVLPAGPRVFVSGQTDPDADLARATRKTLEGLGDTLKHWDRTARRSYASRRSCNR